MPSGEVYDYVVVGGGAAGCVVAARLAEAGRHVLLIEAGDDPAVSKASSAAERSPRADYEVPAFHPFASENPAFAWRFWVRHYADARQKRDKKYYEHFDNERVDGVLYPRATGLGGCASHNAMIVVRPSNADWNHIASITGDASWNASNMQRYFTKMERCRYGNRLWRLLAAATGLNPTGHGYAGWLTTERALPLRLFRDSRLKRALKAGALAATAAQPRAEQRWAWFLRGAGDPNDQRMIDAQSWGLATLPLSTRRSVRVSSRDLLIGVQRRHPDKLSILLNAFVTRIEVDPSTQRAVAVRVVDGAHVYRASSSPSVERRTERRIEARREIILCGGAFNTPQLLMLSGIGDRDHLARTGIDTVVDLPGVGRNLQDRYEIGVVSRMKQPWSSLRGCEYRVGDWPYRLWRWGLGPYVSNGSLFSVTFPSRKGGGQTDLYCFGLLANFHGYFPGYSELIKRQDYMTWAVLKAYTNNEAGTVHLRSKDPFEPPHIQFSYFPPGTRAEDDLEAVVDGIQFVRRIADAADDLIVEEELPGRGVYTRDDLKQHVRDNAWGHHACGTCAMKPLSQAGVVDSSFRVHGIPNLRVVDASIFPRIPGFFIVTSVYMIAEKAADVIIRDRE